MNNESKYWESLNRVSNRGNRVLVHNKCLIWVKLIKERLAPSFTLAASWYTNSVDVFVFLCVFTHCFPCPECVIFPLSNHHHPFSLVKIPLTFKFLTYMPAPGFCPLSLVSHQLLPFFECMYVLRSPPFSKVLHAAYHQALWIYHQKSSRICSPLFYW